MDIINVLTDYVSGLIPNGLDWLIAIVEALLVWIIGKKLVKVIVNILKKGMEKKGADPGVISFVGSVCKVVMYILLVLVITQILGFATSSIVAIVGSAGLAVGLALQGSLANFAGGVLIMLMKPFTVNDYIVVGDMEGTVARIDVVYTTLHTIDHRTAILPNGQLADSNVINVTKAGRRRIDINVGISYSEDIKRVRQVLKQVVDRQENLLEGEQIDLVVAGLDESSVTMAVHVWVSTEDYWTTRWKMLEEIKYAFDENHIEIPFNQLDVNLKGEA